MSLQGALAALITAVGADVRTLREDLYNQSTLVQNLGASEAYLVGSNIFLPTGKIKAGTRYRCRFDVSKTAAGAVAPIIRVRLGGGSLSSSVRATLTFLAQTAAADDGAFEIDVVFGDTGFQVMGRLSHRLSTTGLSPTVFQKVLASSAIFDYSGGVGQIGLSIIPGASAAWTISLVEAEVQNILA